jgi:hypothetical protein
MPAPSRTTLPILLAAACLGGCKSSLEPFRHVHYRLDYAITDDEIRKLRFAVSTDVLVLGEAPPGWSGPSGDTAILLARGSRGVVTDVGPDWIKVSFRKGGSGVPFLARSDGGMTPWGTPDAISYDRYFLATAVEGRDGFEKVTKVPDRVLLVDGEAYQVIKGATAFLMIDKDSINRLIKKRTLTGGN